MCAKYEEYKEIQMDFYDMMQSEESRTKGNYVLTTVL